MIGFKGQERLIKDVANNLVTVSAARSWNLVIPPGFAGDKVALELTQFLLRHAAQPFVARISADGLQNAKDLVGKIYRDWNQCHPITSPKRCEDAGDMLVELLELTGDAHPKVMILTEFHKVLSNIDERFLVCLRDEEQAGRLQTVCVSIFPHKWIRENWHSEGRLLNVSNYGDSHRQRDVEACESEDVVRKDLETRGVPGELACKAYKWTGGYPEPLEAVVSRWEILGSPKSEYDAASLQCEARRAMEPMVERLDPRRLNSRWCDQLLKLHRGDDDEREAYDQIKQLHPWQSVLLDDKGLRAVCLGEACKYRIFERAFNSGVVGDMAIADCQKAEKAYQQEHYDYVVQLLERSISSSFRSKNVQMLLLHAKIMSALNSRQQSILDSNWHDVRRKIGEARRAMPNLIENEKTRADLMGRYADLENLANSVCNTKKAPRVIDTLAGLMGNCPDRQAAFMLLVLQLEAGKRIPGHGAALRAVFELPEQVFRIWAWWVLNLNYYNVADDLSDVWKIVCESWPSSRGPLRKPDMGSGFGGIQVLALVARARLAGRQGQVTEPAEDFKQQLDKDFRIFDLRNEMTHATFISSPSKRKLYFEYIEHLLNRVVDDCPEDRFSCLKARSVIAPLPGIDEMVRHGT